MTLKSNTRYAELHLGKIGREWSFYATDTGSRVGPVYRTKIEALADLTRYARECWGLEA